MDAELEQRIVHIDRLNNLHTSLLAEMLQADGGKMFALDLLACAAIKRSMALCEAFALLVLHHNYVSAISLVRLQLDSCLRFFAAFIVEDPHAFAESILHGMPVRKLKDRDGRLMTDKYLVDTLGTKYEWMPRVYEATSGFIHLSERHIFTVFGPSEHPRSVSLRVGPKDEEIPPFLWIEMADAFLAATDALFEHLKGWTYTKTNPHLAEQARK